MENTSPNTNNFLNWVEIKNFKSIKDLRLDCKRVNVFIGKPNVGKSNILEGLGLLGAGYSTDRFLGTFARYKELKNLFRDSDVFIPIEISSNRQVAFLYPYLGGTNAQLLSDMTYRFFTADYLEYTNLSKTQNSFTAFEQHIAKQLLRLSKDGKLSRLATHDAKMFDEDYNYVKKYDFANLTEFESLFQDFLLPPNGQNLYSVIRRNNELWLEFTKLFTEQELELVLYDVEQAFLLQKKIGALITQYPFFSIADTFRRFMFYITAIESNKDSVIVFEEPEVHSFPPYVKAMAHRIVSSETNQFFVSTHSPYLLQTLISELDESELAVYITYYKDYQTQVRQLTADELQEAQDLSIDLFYNLSRYEPNA